MFFVVVQEDGNKNYFCNKSFGNGYYDKLRLLVGNLSFLLASLK